MVGELSEDQHDTGRIPATEGNVHLKGRLFRALIRHDVALFRMYLLFASSMAIKRFCRSGDEKTQGHHAKISLSTEPAVHVTSNRKLRSLQAIRPTVHRNPLDRTRPSESNSASSGFRWKADQ